MNTLTKVFLGLTFLGNACYSVVATQSVPAKDRLTPSNQQRMIDLENLQDAQLFRTDRDTIVQLPAAIAAYNEQFQPGSTAPRYIKRFKHGNTSDTFLVPLADGSFVVVKTAPASEVMITQRIPADKRNRELSFDGKSPFGRIVCLTHAWINDQVIEIDNIDLSGFQENKQIITFQPYFDGTSSFFKDATPDQYPDWAYKMAQVICFTTKHGIGLSDFHSDNFRYHPLHGFGMFDLHSGGRPFDSFEQIVSSCLFPQFYQLESLEKRLTGEFLPVDLTPAALFLRNVIELCHGHPDLIRLQEKAINFAASEQVSNLLKYLNCLKWRNGPIASATADRFSDLESQYGAQIFTQFHGVDKGGFFREDNPLEVEVKAQLLNCLQTIIRESVESGSAMILDPSIVERNLSQLAGRAFGQFMARVDPFLFVLWCFTKVAYLDGPEEPLQNLLNPLVQHVIREKLYFGQFGQPIGSKSKEWSDILAKCSSPTPAAAAPSE
ncbi:MAG: hypothetical protein LBE97_02400 [Holosporales bacterium]|nr:hypothetical protein [Holosporales bacterium]